MTNKQHNLTGTEGVIEKVVTAKYRRGDDGTAEVVRASVNRMALREVKAEKWVRYDMRQSELIYSVRFLIICFVGSYIIILCLVG